MDYFCYRCGKSLGLSSAKAGRSESCPQCNNDLHCCKNCSYYDERAYNSCKEPQADRVLEKDRSNFCDYFQFLSGTRKAEAGDAKKKVLNDLDALFKK